jgi:hypothetical protein
MSDLPPSLKSLRLVLFCIVASDLECTFQNLPPRLQSFELRIHERKKFDGLPLLGTLPPTLTHLSVEGIQFHPSDMMTLPKSITSLQLRSLFTENIDYTQTESIQLPYLRRFSALGDLEPGHVRKNPSFYARLEHLYTDILTNDTPLLHLFSNLRSLSIPTLDENQFGILSGNLRSIAISSVGIHDDSGVALKNLPADLRYLWLGATRASYKPIAVAHLPRFIETLTFPITTINEATWRDYPVLLSILTLSGPDFVNGDQHPITRRISESPPHLHTVRLFQEYIPPTNYKLRCGLRTFTVTFTDGSEDDN